MDNDKKKDIPASIDPSIDPAINPSIDPSIDACCSSFFFLSSYFGTRHSAYL